MFASEPLLLEIEGMKCGGCVRAVEQRLLEQPGVQQASVNLLTRTAWVQLDLALAAADQGASLEPIQKALAALGFQARLREVGQEISSRRERLQHRNWWEQWRQLVVALALLVVSVFGHLGQLGSMGFHGLVATVALAGPGRPILVRGWQGAWAGMPSMDTLVGLGLASAYLASGVGLFWPESGWPCFFNEPVLLLGFVLLGRFLEERARFRTGRALEDLASLQPDTAQLLMGEGPPRSVRVGGLRPGDRLQLLPGDRVPVDGVVRAGASAVDVSGLTGEPLPLQATVDTELAAGSLNLEAPLELEVSRCGSDSAIARIIRLVEQAQARKAPIQRLVDRLAGQFTFLVLGLALVTFVFWWQWGAALWPQVLGAHATTPLALALQLSISVLVVACPCALGLATPTAITVGSGQAARAGLLFRGGDAIEAAAQVGAILFDKTGTLTLGRPVVIAIETFTPGAMAAGQFPSAEHALLQLAASLEASSRHPLAYALLVEAQRLELPLLETSDCRSVAGQGVEGIVKGEHYRVGRLAWVQAGLDPSLPAQAPAPAGDLADLPGRQQRLEADGATVLAVANRQGVLGLVAVQDQPRRDAALVIQQLRAMGLQLGLLSGDRQQPVQQLGALLGLRPEELAWELRPEQKLEHLDQFPHQGTLAMVGDGINDAPALAAADLGIAVGTGTQIAQDTADLVVLGDGLEGLVLALGLARRTMAKVRQNLAWAFGYNLIVLPLAAGVLLPRYGLLLTPSFSALLMAMSSITVVANALLLQDGRHQRG
ncbi:heavy metal translocating P-type ATPase [Cyanobium sp. WAJ14-Wanaka]|uniref:heavy metal translocating P-type ATPase n=1 Tax=Cyanobium sp. WAJ14-Wanaka TaxID=2823725 RepID=UPI0037BEC5E1